MDKTAAIFCRQLATQVPAMFYNFYLVKKKLLISQQPLKLVKKYLELLELKFFLQMFD